MRPPRLDHVSLAGEPATFETLGFRVTSTSGASHHGRIFLDRAYLEVTPAAPGQQGLGSRGWFLRPEDPATAAESLRTAGLTVVGPSPYRGDDGHWVDVMIDSVGAALPILTRRVDRISDSWPPLLQGSHPNGAYRISGLRLRLVEAEPISSVLATIGVQREDADTFVLPGDARLEIEVSDLGAEGVVTVFVQCRGGAELELAVEPQTDQVVGTDGPAAP